MISTVCTALICYVKVEDFASHLLLITTRGRLQYQTSHLELFTEVYTGQVLRIITISLVGLI